MTDTPMTPDRNGPVCTQEAARAAGLDVAPSPAELLATSESIVHAWDDLWAKPEEVTVSIADAGQQLARALPLVLAEVDRLRARVAELEAATGTARAMHRKHTDSEHCQADDMTWPCPTVTALSEAEAAELAEGQAGLDAMRADHPAPCRVPDSPDCTCPTSETS